MVLSKRLVSLLAVTTAMAAVPALAQADVITPKVVTPHVVTPHVVSPAPSPTPAPTQDLAPTEAPAQNSAPTTSTGDNPDLHASGDEVTYAPNADLRNREEEPVPSDFPGSWIPDQPGATPFPQNYPSADSRHLCDLDCEQVWYGWIESRSNAILAQVQLEGKDLTPDTQRALDGIGFEAYLLETKIKRDGGVVGGSNTGSSVGPAADNPDLLASGDEVTYAPNADLRNRVEEPVPNDFPGSWIPDQPGATPFPQNYPSADSRHLCDLDCEQVWYGWIESRSNAILAQVQLEGKDLTPDTQRALDGIGFEAYLLETKIKRDGGVVGGSNGSSAPPISSPQADASDSGSDLWDEIVAAVVAVSASTQASSSGPASAPAMSTGGVSFFSELTGFITGAVCPQGNYQSVNYGVQDHNGGSGACF